jgi:ABC-2 type transport system permease protein
MGLAKEIKRYSAFGEIGIKETFLYPINLFSRIVIHLVRITVYIFIYRYLIEISVDGTLGGLNLVQAVWSVSLVQIIGQSSRYIYKEIQKEVKTGALSIKLNKPYDYIYSIISKSYIEGLFKMLVFIIVTTAFLFLVVGLPVMNISIVFWILITSAFGLLLNILVEILIGLSTFWIENSDPVYWVLNRSAWLINGMMVPVALLPLWIKRLSTYYPLSITFIAGRAFESGINYIFVLAVLILWVAVLLILSRIIYNKALQRLTIHGG